MVFIVVVGALAVAGAVALALYAAQLYRSAGDVLHEVQVTTDRMMQIRALADQLQLRPGTRD